MKTILKTLLATAILAATASTAFAEAYLVDSVDGSVKVNISVQGAGVSKVPSPAIALPPDGVVRQHLSLNADHSMTGALSFFDGTSTADLFPFSGSWYRPAGGKVIYIALDGDSSNPIAPSQGGYGAYNALYDPESTVALMALPEFMPILFSDRVSSLIPIYPATKLKTGIIKLQLKGDQITSASTEIEIIGRGMVQYCKKANKEAQCLNTGAPKDAAYGFSASSKSTVAVP
ncbi:MAG TPA: hypothetical protein VLB90_00935 [Pseudomonadales bacterium]|nr:hypothetical protein [Pseudomonadales bacterium]